MTAVRDIDVVRPTDLAEARDAMLDSGRGRALLIRGAGTKLDWGAPAKRHELTVETSSLHRLLTHDPADATATVQAGMPLSALQAELATTGQWLAIDPPHADATVGGVFAANATGPRRLRFGSMRDLVIGMTMVTADGQVARSGGKVIKNVAGYDLAKLLCGSLGTLGLVAELVVRLHPLPAASRTVTAEMSPAAATRLMRTLLASPLVVSAADWTAQTLAIRIEGREGGVSEQTRAVTRLVADGGAEPTVVAGGEEADVWRRLAADHAGRKGETVAVAATLPSAFGEVAEAIERTCDETGVEGRLASHLGNGLHSVRWSGPDAAAHGRAVRSLRERVAKIGGHVILRRRHEQLTDPEVIWGPAPSAVAAMRAVKQQFDGLGRCAPGRFVGGI